MGLFSKDEQREEERTLVEMPPSRFTLVCEGRDGKLCLFKDADGHLTVVRSDRLA